MTPDHYQLLGVLNNADTDLIKAAFRVAAKKVHPDLAPSREANRKFQELQHAYSVLVDPAQRASYDQSLRSCSNAEHTSDRRNTPPQTSPPKSEATSQTRPYQNRSTNQPRLRTPAWLTKFGNFSSVEVSGMDDDVIDLPPTVQAAIVYASGGGRSHFAIEAVNGRNQMVELLVNTTRPYQGVTAYGVLDSGTKRRLKVTASEAWHIRIDPLGVIPTASSSFKANGDAVFSYEGPAARMKISCETASHFAVHQAWSPHRSNLLVNRVGRYSGTVLLEAGPSFLIFDADDPWESNIRQ